MVAKKNTKSSEYTAESLQVLTGLEPVRMRPGMYTDTASPNHLALEAIDNSVDEALAGHAKVIKVVHHKDGSLSVIDDGRGMPTDRHPEEKISGVELILTRLHAGGKFSKKNYKYSGGLHGVGISVVNALSDKLLVKVKRDGQCFEMSFAHGEPTSKLRVTGKCKVNDTGTTITFWPEKKYFDTLKFQMHSLKQNLRAKAVLCSGLRVLYIDEAKKDQEEWCYEDGLQEYLEESIEGCDIITEAPWVGQHVTEEESVSWALAWLPNMDGGIRESYVNLIPTIQGGTHVNGMRTGLLEAFKEFCELQKLIPRGVRLTTDDIWEFCRCILSIKIPLPQFSGQTKERLSSRECAGLVSSAIKDAFSLWLNQHVPEAKILAELVIDRAQSRLKNSKKVVRKKIAAGPALPGKLADCSSQNTEESELFLVEGDSAGGSAKQARFRSFQAIMPLRGKILNTWEVSSDQVLSSQEVHNIAIAIGIDPGSDDLSGLRYGKICILADADSDGLHIATLLCALFLKHFPKLVEEGYVYVAMPPLYRIDLGKEIYYALDDQEKQSILERLEKEKKRSTPQIQRFKGLGEMNPLQLRETTLDPATRRLMQLVLEDAEDSVATLDMMLAKKRASDRREWLEMKGNIDRI